LQLSTNVQGGLTTAIGDVGATQTSEIDGQAFVDTDGDGRFDGRDFGYKGATVFLDTNNNGRLDLGETSGNTRSIGGFSFTIQKPGRYSVRLMLPPNAGVSQAFPRKNAPMKLVVGRATVYVENFFSLQPIGA